MKVFYFLKKPVCFLPMCVVLCGFFTQYSTLAQTADLGPFIGLETLPNDDDAVCPIPMFPEIDIEMDGMMEGDLIPDFKLFQLDGSEVQASNLLSDGKPALFISCSYTCPVFRDNLPFINDVYETYSDSLHIYLVYVVEAHPIIDNSPYSNEVHVTSPNYEDNILYRQPINYLKRKLIVEDMLDAMPIDVPVLIDGPCNEWWLNFGTNPNCAVLIDKKGKIFDVQDWFNNYPENIYASINDLLAIEDEEPEIADGYFSVEDISTDCFTGEAGTTITADILVKNIDDKDAFLNILRSYVIMPDDWSVSICTDVCYDPSTDSATLFVEAGEEFMVHFYFYTSEIENNAEIQVLFENYYHAANAYEYTIRACSFSNATEIENTTTNNFSIFPNPVQDFLTIKMNSISDVESIVQIVDMHGKICLQTILPQNSNQVMLNVSGLPKGMYFANVQTQEKTEIQKIVIQ